jgi:hypothetical protein
MSAEVSIFPRSMSAGGPGNPSHCAASGARSAQFVEHFDNAADAKGHVVAGTPVA